MLLTLALVGCAHGRGHHETPGETELAESKKAAVEEPPVAAPEMAPPKAPKDDRDHGLYDGSTGENVTLESFVESAENADFIAFGELHKNMVGSRVQLELLTALAKQKRPLALAMEFFERNQQKDIDRYLASDISEEKFIDWMGLGDAYKKNHRPLIEFCKANGIPVIAANTPRPLVKELRKLGGDYTEFLATLSEDDVLCVPESMTPLNEEEKKRFTKFMGGHGPKNESFMVSMALWDDTMAESATKFRAENPEHRVMLIVGMFHVMNKAGTVRKYAERRPDDQIRSLIMVPGEVDSVAFAESDRGLGDVVFKVKKSAPKKPAVHGGSQ